MNAAAALMMSFGNPMIVCDAADFDAANDYMTIAGLTGAADSKKGIFSAWIRLDGGNGGLLFVLDGGNDYFRVLRFLDNKFAITGSNAATTQILDLVTVATYTAGATWLHLLASWDLGTPGASNLYINDVSDKSVGTFTDDMLDYTFTNWAIGATPGGSGKFNGSLAEVYFAPGRYLDFSIASNRRKFISASGKPVHLGTTGALPTGTSPLVYQHLDDGETVANFATNRGTGGNFTITGTLDTASSSPSD